MALRKLERDGSWRVAAGSPDIRRFRLYDGAGAKVGVIAGLLFDTEIRVVRFAVADLWDRQVLVPVGLIDVDEARRRVVAHGWSRERLLELPAYDPAAQDGGAPAMAGGTGQAASGEEVQRRPPTPSEATAGLTSDDDVVRIPVYAEELVVERRTVLKEVIEIRKRKRVEVVHVRENVQHEVVEISDKP